MLSALLGRHRNFKLIARQPKVKLLIKFESHLLAGLNMLHNKIIILLLILLLNLFSLESICQQSNKKNWSEWFPFKNYPYLLYSLTCRETSYSKDKEWIWEMKIKNTSNIANEFDFFYQESPNGKKKSTGRMRIKAVQEKIVSTPLFTKIIPCGNTIYVGIERLEVVDLTKKSEIKAPDGDSYQILSTTFVYEPNAALCGYNDYLIPHHAKFKVETLRYEKYDNGKFIKSWTDKRKTFVECHNP